MFGRKRKLDDFTAEIEAHLLLEIERLREQGLNEEDARASAHRTFGNVTQARETFYESGRWLSWDHFWQDVRYGLRMLRKTPGFTLMAVVTLGLGIGANTAIFSVVDALLLKNLPYAHPERMGTLYMRTTGPQAANERRNVDGEQWEMLRDDVPSLLCAVSSMGTNGANLRAGSHVQYLHAGRVSAHYFDVLGLQPVLGRNFSEDEDRPHGPKAAVLSYGLWRTTFGVDRSVLGQAMLLKGEPYTIIGVLPENATTPLNADLYTALQATRDGEGQGTNFALIVRLQVGSTWQEANAEMNRAFARTMRVQNFAKNNPGAQRAYYFVPLQKSETNTLRPQVLALMLAAGFILLIACANLAGLTLVRMLRRTGEIATRLALGASPWQIQRQLWIENLQLALLGGAVGIEVGFLALRGLLLLLPEHFLPVATVPLDSGVLAFTLLLTLMTSVLFGMLPAFTTRKVDLRSSIGSRAVIGARTIRLRQALIAGEVALTVVLLAAAGLLIRTLIHLETMPPGFNPNGVITAKASLDEVRYNDPTAFRKLLNKSLASMREIPGVQNAALGLTLPYERALINGVYLKDGKESGQGVETNEVYVTPGYFDTLQIAVVAGRAFADADGPDTQQVVVINQSFARKAFHSADPEGRYLNIDNKNVLIVGVVADTVQSSAGELHIGSAPLTSEETIYVPAAQMDAQFLPLVHSFFQPSWIVRTSSPVEGLTGQMQRALAKADPNLPFSGFYDMKDLMAATLATQRIEVALLAAMASLALLLSAVGVFALVANMVVQKTREIGIRMALGSTVGQAMLQIGRSGVGASLLGVVLGLVFSAGALRVMRGVLYGISVYDVPTMATVVFTLVLVTLLATILPILKIAKIDPANTLREE
jgi:macrolide transport system ATP-binding/permease protein